MSIHIVVICNLSSSFQVCQRREMIKQMVLATVALSARIVEDLAVFGDELNPDHEFWDIYYFSIMRKVFSVAAVCVQILCVYAAYTFGENMYNNCCSKCCHNPCKLCVEKCAERRYLKGLGPEMSAKYFML